MKKLTDAEWKRRFDEYMEQVGPNPGTSFYGAWGWASLMSANFGDMMHDEGYEIEGYDEEKAEEAELEAQARREEEYVGKFGQEAWDALFDAENQAELAREAAFIAKYGKEAFARLEGAVVPAEEPGESGNPDLSPLRQDPADGGGQGKG
jgi:hypothetical protein